MKLTILLLLILSQESLARGTLTGNSYNGTRIGDSVSDALKNLHGFSIDEEEKKITDGECYTLLSVNGNSSATLMIIDGNVVRIDVGSSDIVTDKGIAVGSKRADVFSKYKGVETLLNPSDGVSEILKVQVTSGTLIYFFMRKEIVNSMSVGRYPEIDNKEGCM